MSAVAILNIVLVVVVTAGIFSFLGWSIVADQARVASHPGRERQPVRGNTAQTTRGQRGPAHGFTA